MSTRRRLSEEPLSDAKQRMETRHETPCNAAQRAVALGNLRAASIQLQTDYPEHALGIVDFVAYYQDRGLIRPSNDVADLTEQLCEYMRSVVQVGHSFVAVGGDETDLKRAFSIARDRLRKARSDIDKAYAALAEAEAEFTEEARAVDLALAALMRRLDDQFDVSDPKTVLSICLMQLVRAAGFGVVGPHRYGTSAAAALLNAVTRTYDFTFNEPSLCSLASYLPEIPKRVTANLDDHLKNFARNNVRPIEQSKVSDDEPEGRPF